MCVSVCVCVCVCVCVILFILYNDTNVYIIFKYIHCSILS